MKKILMYAMLGLIAIPGLSWAGKLQIECGCKADTPACSAATTMRIYGVNEGEEYSNIVSQACLGDKDVRTATIESPGFVTRVWMQQKVWSGSRKETRRSVMSEVERAGISLYTKTLKGKEGSSSKSYFIQD